MFFDTDCGGVVHNIAYLRMIETCRTKLAGLMGMDLPTMAKTQLYPVVVRTEIDYRASAKLGDHLEINGHVTEFDGEEHIDVLLADGLADFLQAGNTVFRRHRVFHFVESHRAAVGEYLVGRADVGAVFHEQGDQLRDGQIT